MKKMNAKNRLRQMLGRLSLPYHILRCRLTGVFKPLVVLLYVTDRCNLACAYCRGHWSGRKIRDFTTAEIKAIVDECAGLGTRHFIIHGGEILLRPDVREIIAHIKGRSIYVNLVTNGILLPEKIDEIRGVDGLCISLDGGEAANDKNRGKGSYKKIIEAIKAAKKEDFKLTVQATLTRHSWRDIGLLSTLARDIGYFQQFSLLLKPLKPQGGDIALTEEETREALNEITRFKKLGYPVFTSFKTLENALNWRHASQTIGAGQYAKDKNAIRCYYGRLKLVIDADGFACPCSALNNGFKALNVLDSGVKAAYERVLETNECAACRFLTQNDWNLLFGLSPSLYLEQMRIQLKAIFNYY